MNYAENVAERKVILDGVEYSADQISPAKHRFIGTFRYPTPEQQGFKLTDTCPACAARLGVCKADPTCVEPFCKMGMLDLRGKHWQLGHFDLPQYVTIKEYT